MQAAYTYLLTPVCVLLLSVVVCSSRIVITASAVNRATKRVDLKAIVDEAIGKAAKEGYRDVQKVLVYEKSALPRCAVIPHVTCLWRMAAGVACCEIFCLTCSWLDQAFVSGILVMLYNNCVSIFRLLSKRTHGFYFIAASSTSGSRRSRL
jgi:hypothetical protein